MKDETKYDDAEDIYYGPIQDYSSLTNVKTYPEFKARFKKLGFKAPEKQLRRAWGYVLDGRRDTTKKVLSKFW